MPPDPTMQEEEPARDPGQPMAKHKGHVPVIVWDEYHGFVVGRRDPLTGAWKTDLPYAFEFGGKELDLEPVRFWPLPPVPPSGKRRRAAMQADEKARLVALVDTAAEAIARLLGGDPEGPEWPQDWLPNEVAGYRRMAHAALLALIPTMDDPDRP